jgi:cytoskeletal protein CcmA (bactofilin family)
MFSKGSKPPSSPPASPTPPLPVSEDKPRPRVSSMPSIVSAGLQVTGNLVSDGDVQIEGTIEGDVKSRLLTVGEGGCVKGSISAKEVIVSGTVEGKIKASTVTIAHTARVIGDVVHDHLSVEAGAYLNGSLKRLNKTDEREEAKPQDPKKSEETFAAIKREIREIGGTKGSSSEPAKAGTKA